METPTSFLQFHLQLMVFQEYHSNIEEILEIATQTAKKGHWVELQIGFQFDMDDSIQSSINFGGTSSSSNTTHIFTLSIEFSFSFKK